MKIRSGRRPTSGRTPGDDGDSMGEDKDLLEEIENEKHRQDLKSVLNKKAYSKYELEEVMIGIES